MKKMMLVSFCVIAVFTDVHASDDVEMLEKLLDSRRGGCSSVLFDDVRSSIPLIKKLNADKDYFKANNALEDAFGLYYKRDAEYIVINGVTNSILRRVANANSKISSAGGMLEKKKADALIKDINFQIDFCDVEGASSSVLELEAIAQKYE